ncbi:MAG: hypothetical protein ACOC0P_07720 [Planctomycetota bacterium]
MRRRTKAVGVGAVLVSAGFLASVMTFNTINTNSPPAPEESSEESSPATTTSESFSEDANVAPGDDAPSETASEADLDDGTGSAGDDDASAMTEDQSRLLVDVVDNGYEIGEMAFSYEEIQARLVEFANASGTAVHVRKRSLQNCT